MKETSRSIKKVFLDTNILLDYLLERKPFDTDAAALFKFVQDNKVKAFISILSWINCNYILSKYNNSETVDEALKILDKYTEITDLKASYVNKAMDLKLFEDKEDALQYLSALDAKVDCIITRDYQGFKNSKLPVSNAEKFLLKIISKQ